MWKDLNDYWADQRCIECDRHLDRRGHLCSACLIKADMEKFKEAPPAAINKVPVDAWEFLDQQFRQIFGPRK